MENIMYGEKLYTSVRVNICSCVLCKCCQRTSRGSPESLDNDLRSPEAPMKSSTTVLSEFEWLFIGETRERGDGELSGACEAQDSLLCNRK